jgi:hypothetical protein
MNMLKDIRSAYANLNPEGVRTLAEKELHVGLVADSDAVYAAMEQFLAPAHLPPQKRAHALAALHRHSESSASPAYDLVLYEEGLPQPKNSFTFHANDPEKTISEILDERQELELPLARTFQPFRDPVVDRVVQRVSRENALFALLTALPNIIPSFIELPWSLGEFASDTAFLTINQVRMAFLITAATDKHVGYVEQKGEIVAIIASAFGWRALARELVGKIPLGGGLLAKGAVAFAGTYVVGKSLDRYHRTGYGMSKTERRAAYQEAFNKGKGIVEGLLSSIKKPSAA